MDVRERDEETRSGDCLNGNPSPIESDERSDDSDNTSQRVANEEIVGV